MQNKVTHLATHTECTLEYEIFATASDRPLYTGVQMITEFTEDMNKMSLKTGRIFSPKP